MMKRKMLSILLALCMVCSLLPTMAFAEVEVTTHHTCDASCGHVDGDPHSDSNLTWEPWNSTNTLPYSGNYYLTKDVILSATCTVSGTLNLCLNGHTITPSGSGFCAIKITGNLSLTDCRGTGEITGFTNNAGKGGAVYSTGTFTMYGGIIRGNTVTYQYYNGGMGGGVYSEGTFTMHGGTISGNEAERYGGGVYIAPGKQFTMYGGTISDNKVTIIGDMYNFGGGGVYSEGNFTMSGGTIKNNKANTKGKGGGVCISNISDSTATSTFTMNDGEIIDNEAKYGGGVYINSKKQFTMKNGTISGNTSSEYGGGVYVNGTFTMSNGTISGNNAGYGGGVYIGSSASFTMTGGTITGNAATTYGGGVYMYTYATAFNLSDSPIISGNTGDNCYIYNMSTCMTVTDELRENAKIGITTWSSKYFYPFCKPADSVDLSNYKNWFFSDSISHDILQNGDGSLYTNQVPTYTVTFNANGQGAAPTAQTVTSGGKAAEPAAPTADGYTFGGWYKESTCVNKWDFSTNTVSANITLYAKWTEDAPITYTVTFDANGAMGTAPTQVATAEGGTFKLPTATDLAKDGYTFAGWNDGTTTYQAGATYTMPAKAVVFTAQWEVIPTYTVTFDANGHGTAPDAIESVTSGSTITAPTAPTADGYTFGGWYTDASCTAAFDFATAITGNITLYAKWTQNAPTPPPTPITYYDLWVAGVQVKSDNLEIDSSDNAAISGSATYDPDSNTLTLTNFKHAGEYYYDEAAETSAIRVKENGITIVFSGENMIEGTGDCGLYADVGDHIKLKAADKNSTLTFTCENGYAFWHIPEFVGSIAIYAGSSEAEAKFRTHSAFVKSPHPYDFKYVKFVPATPMSPIATPTPSVKMDVEDATLNDAAKAVGSAVKSGNADIIPAEGYTKESIAKMQNSGELNLAIEKNAGYDEAEKKLLDDAITAKGGAAGSVMYLEIDALLMSDDGKVVAEVDDTIVDLTITVDLNAEMQKAAKEGKTIYVARAHDGKVAFLEGTLNADKTKVTFDSSKFSTYALVASDSQTVISPQTADAGIFLAVSMSVLSVTGSAVLLKKKED